MITLLITRPNYDDTTFYCCQWSQELIETAEERNINVIDLKGKNATKEKTEGVLRKKNPRLVFFNGHGSDASICGHNNEVLIKSGENDILLKGKIIHTLSCNSSLRLGPSAVKNGASAFIGYDNNFVFFWNKNKAAHPTEDEIAKPFFDAAIKAPYNLLKGKTAKESVRRAKIAYDHWITYYRLNDHLPESPQNLIGLIWDKSNLTFHGDPNAKID